MRVRSRGVQVVLVAFALALLGAPAAFAHIKIYPMESTFGAREKYTMRVPNERQSPAIKVEGEFPAGLEVYDFEFKPGWKIEFKKDEKGKIIGATWTGRIEPYEFVEFGMLAINPKSGDPNMLWKFYQYYEDGFKEEFTAPPDAKMPLRPMPLVVLKPAQSTSVAPDQKGPASASATTSAAANGMAAKPAMASGDAGGEDLVAQGRAKFESYQCTDCHGDKGEGTDDAPDLNHSHLTAEQVAKFLQKPSTDAVNKGMPNIDANSPDLRQLVAYVMSLRAK